MMGAKGRVGEGEIGRGVEEEEEEAGRGGEGRQAGRGKHLSCEGKLGNLL